MDFTLSAALDLNNLPVPNIIGISEEELCSASFLFGALIEYKVKQNIRVVLILHNQTFGHYCGICTKLGINLQALKENKQLLVIDVMTKLGEEYMNSGKDENWPKSLLEDTFFQVHDLLKESTSPATIFIDLPEIIGLVFGKWQLVMKYISILSSLKTIEKTNLVFMVKAIKGNQPLQVVNSTISHISDLFINVRGLRTGSAQDISGSIEISKKETMLDEVKRQSEFHYQLLDRTIKLFAPGTVQFR